MKYLDTNTGSGTTTKENNTKIFLSFLSWCKIWWPVILLVTILTIAGVSKYMFPNKDVYSIMMDLIKAIGILMVVMYVIYTRLLAIETKNMTEVSKRLYSSEKGSVLAEAIISVCDFNELPNEASKITEVIHIDDKKLTKEEFGKFKNETELPAISVKIKNICGRRIEAMEIRYKVRHTGTRDFHEVNCNISKIGKILPWEDKVIGLIIAPEGEIEVFINKINFIDGDIEKPANIIINQLLLERLRQPEKVKND